jgi:hypothetical protein
VGPTPILPDYAGANVRGIVPALLGPGDWATSLPDWMPSALRDARQVVLLILDGLGWDQLMDHKSSMPTVSTMAGSAITTVAPTTTATALTSISTGLTPGEHGLIGYRISLHSDVLNVLRWNSSAGDRRRAHPPRDLQPFAPFLGREVPVISQAELERSAFTEAHLRGSRAVGYRTPSAIAPEVGRQLAAGEQVVYAYYGGIDKTAHERGFGDFYDAELGLADHLVASVLEVLPPGAALVITADHGQVHVGDRIVHPSDALLRTVAHQSGEGRFRWLHARPGAAADLLQTATDELGRLAWVVPKEQTIDEGWFGPVVAAPVAARLGDVALAAYESVSFYESADTGPFDLVCRHGSLTPAEVYVPLLAFLAE